MLCMEVHLDDEKSHVNPCPHNGIQCGLKDHCVTSFFIKLKMGKSNEL